MSSLRHSIGIIAAALFGFPINREKESDLLSSFDEGAGPLWQRGASRGSMKCLLPPRSCYEHLAVMTNTTAHQEI
jgi:hypothetical protein